MLKYGFYKKLRTSVQMNLWPVEHFFLHFLAESVPKSEEKSVQLVSRFICTEVRNFL